MCHLFDDEQRAFITRFAEYANRLNDEQIAIEDAEEEAKAKAWEEAHKSKKDETDTDS